jgi:hypothetical protein
MMEINRLNCINCKKTDVRYTVQFIICNRCGECLDRIYETDLYEPSFKEVSEFSQPLLQDNLKSVTVIENLLSWSKLDITLRTKQQLIAYTSILKEQLRINSITYPSEYFLAGCIVFSRKFDIDANIALEHLSSDYTKKHGEMIRIASEIEQSISANSKNTIENLILYDTTELNNETIDYIDRYLDDYWKIKINQVLKIQKNGKLKTEREILRKAKVSASSYYRAKKRIMDGPTKKKSRSIITDEIGERIKRFHAKGFVVRDIQVELAIETRLEGNMINIHFNTIARYLSDVR